MIVMALIIFFNVCFKKTMMSGLNWLLLWVDLGLSGLLFLMGSYRNFELLNFKYNDKLCILLRKLF